MLVQAVQQIAFADRILLNKIDLISEGERATVNHVIKVKFANTM